AAAAQEGQSEVNVVRMITPDRRGHVGKLVHEGAVDGKSEEPIRARHARLFLRRHRQKGKTATARSVPIAPTALERYGSPRPSMPKSLRTIGTNATAATSRPNRSVQKDPAASSGIANHGRSCVSLRE